MKNDQYCHGEELKERIWRLNMKLNTLLYYVPKGREHISRFVKRHEKIRAMNARLTKLSIRLDQETKEGMKP